MDPEFELALELSKITYEQERQQVEQSQNLIAFEDVNESVRRQQIEDIQRLYNDSSNLQHQRPSSFAAYAPSHFPNVGGSEWRSISFPNRLSQATAVSVPVHELTYQPDGHGTSVPTSSTMSQYSQPRPAVLWKQESFNASSDAGRGHVSPLSSAPLIVPFRPISTRLINGDLIDLGEPDGLEIGSGGIHEFDPLWKPPPVAVNEVQAVDSGLRQNTGWNVPPEIPHRSTSLVVAKATERHQAGSSRKSSAAVIISYSEADLELRSSDPLSLKQLNNLRSHSYPESDGNLLFYSSVVDYLTTTAPIVKITVNKDYSWARSLNPADDYISFTCSVSSSIAEILDNILMTFLTPAELSANDGQLPSNEYGLKIFGLDEFLPKSSKLGQCPNLNKALMFGKDFRLEVGKLVTLTSATRVENRDTRRKYFNRACVVESELNVALDFVKREMRRAEESFNTDSFSTAIHAVLQSLKSLCVLIHRIQPYDLISALKKYGAAETKAEFKRFSSEVFGAIYRMIKIYSRSSNAQFRLKAEKDEGRPIKDVVDVQEELLLCVESVHNLPDDWVLTYDSFYMTVHLIHGTAEVCRGWREHPRPLDSKGLFPTAILNLWVTFELPICVTPREARFVFVLYGVKKTDIVNPGEAGSSNNTVTSMGANMQPAKSSGPIDKTHTVVQLACSSFPVFDYNGMFCQGSFMMPLKRGDAVHPWGARPLVSSPGEPVAIITLPEFKYDIRFPPVVNVDQVSTCDFATLPCNTQEVLLDILEATTTNNLTSDEKETLWEKRYYLTHLPHALPLVLASAVGWDWASLNNTYRMINDWTALSPVQSVELLLPHFPDMTVRRKAVDWLRHSSSEFLFNFLPQLIEALRFEPWECSALAIFLLDISVRDNRFAFEIYWQLQIRIENSTDRGYSARCQMLQEELAQTIGSTFASEVSREHSLLATLDDISQSMRSCPEGRMLSVMQQHLNTMDSELLNENVRLPLIPSYLCTGVAVGECNYFNSLTKPMKITFKGLNTNYRIIYKIGDDMRQDAIVLQMVRMMNEIWLSDFLDLRMIIFRCLPTGVKKGMIELVDDCQTLCEIQSAQGATGVFRDDVLNNWLLMQNPSEFQYKIALENFQRSCAGWCVATYLLGVGDRHNDNILVTTSGHVFHIDFGKYMGDWQMAAGFKRDRVPFIFTSDMAYVINGGSQQSTEQYQNFVDNCCKAFNLLRKRQSLLLNLMKLMVCSGIPGMDTAAVTFVQNNLMLNLSETEATVQFTRMIQESLQSKFPRLNFFAHTLVQLKNSSSIITKLGGPRDNPNLLSFAPTLYTKKDDGRIDSVKVVGFEKWKMPDKTYIYRCEVRRKNVNVFSTVYRTFAEFNELHVKLCRRFPIAILPPLSRGTTMGRSNIRSVAQRRQFDIQLFLQQLFELSDEIAHCDFIYTFFHSIYRDCDPAAVNKGQNLAQAEETTERNSSNVNGAGNIFLRLSYVEAQGHFSVFVGHGKHIPLVGSGQPPDSYVKTYLRPDPQRASKKKTQVVKNTQNPTFNEEITYNLLGEYPLTSMMLKVAIWHYGSVLVKDNCMLGCIYIPLTKLDEVKVDRKGVKCLENWFELSRYE